MWTWVCLLLLSLFVSVVLCRDLTGSGDVLSSVIGLTQQHKSTSSASEELHLSSTSKRTDIHSGGVACRAVPDKDLYVPPFEPPYTAPDIPWDFHMQPPGATTPEQVAVFPAARNGSMVFVRFVIPRHCSNHTADHFVTYGLSPETMVHKQRPTRTSQYSYGPYTSGTIHFVALGPLTPSTLYFYRVNGLDFTFNFTSLPAPGSSTLHLALVGDVGQTFNSSATLQNVLHSNATLVLFAGDVSYADHYGPPCHIPESAFPSCSPSRSHPQPTSLLSSSSKSKVCGLGGLRWDSVGRLSQDTFAHKLSAYVAGNHELELEPRWGELEPFRVYQERIPQLLDDSPQYPIDKDGNPLWFGGFPAKSPLFYSLDAGPVHIIGLSSYSSFVQYSHQWYWLLDDLCTIDRSATPWIIVFLHVPLYNTNIGHYIEGEAMRQELEDFLHEAGVDLVVSGHVHAYERSFPVHRMKVKEDGCGAVHVTVGDGGNIEELAGPFVEPQPGYSAYREESFGHAELIVDGPNSATYRWFRNQGGKRVMADEFSLVNQALSCGRTTPAICHRLNKRHEDK